MKWLNIIFTYLPFVLQGVKAVESVIGAGKGSTKKQIVMDAITAGAKVGETVPESHVAGIGLLIDSVVASLNNSGLFNKSASTVQK